LKNNSKIASIDCGSNSIKYRQYRWDKSNVLVLEDTKRLKIRLGSGAFSGHSLITNDVVAAIVEGFKKLAERAQKNSASIVRAVGTSALRSAGNAKEMCEIIRKDIGVEIIVLSGNEEARLLKYVQPKKAFKKKNCLVVDIGGGSTELYHLGNNKEFVRSVDLGAVRVMGNHDKASEWSFLKSMLVELNHESIEAVLGVGANARIAVRLSGAENASSASLGDLKTAGANLAGVSIQNLSKAFSLSTDRAELVPHAIKIWTAILERLPCANLHASKWSLCDGVIQQWLVDNNFSTCQII
jgi:exopolyphosphatase/guanosine-5'-triphosphate,3'-diphosphate pyrophosphatase